LQFDVIIAGAGPAGAYTAYKLARKNISVLLLEKEQLPRYKSCGGAISYKAQELLADFNLDSVIEQKIRKITFSYAGKTQIPIELKTPFVQLVMRDKFDHFLVQQARSAGAQVKENTAVANLSAKPNHITVISNETEYTAHLIVGADGFNSLVGNQLGLKPITHTAVGFEKELQVPTSRLQQQDQQISLDYGILPQGYGWIFPKQNHLSVGVATYQSGINLKQKLTTYLQQENLTNHTELKAKGHLLPIWQQAAKLNNQQGLIVGDAAGLIDPLSGEGIYYALKSGELASQAIENNLTSQQPLDEYTNLINQTLVPEFKMAKLLTKPFFNFPQQIHQLISRKPEIFTKFLRVIYGAQSYNNLYESFTTEIPFFN